MIWSPLIPMWEVHPTKTLSVSNIGNRLPSITVHLKVAASFTKQAVLDLLGTPRVHPYAFLDVPFYAVECRAVHDGGAYRTLQGETIDAEKYNILEMVYSARLGEYYKRTYNNGTNTYYIEDTMDPRMEYFPYNTNLLCWGNDSLGNPGATPYKPLGRDETPSKPHPGTTFVRIVQGFPLLDKTWYEYQGTTHMFQFTSRLLLQTFEPESLLLRHFHAFRDFSHETYALGYPTWTLVLKYEYRKLGWNRFWRANDEASKEGYYDILYKKNKQPLKPFPYKDHSPFLF